VEIFHTFYEKASHKRPSFSKVEGLVRRQALRNRIFIRKKIALR
jgi:hypothetical protein